MAITIEPETVGVIVSSGLLCLAGGAKVLQRFKRNGNGKPSGGVCAVHQDMKEDISALFDLAKENSDNISYIRGRIDEALKK